MFKLFLCFGAAAFFAACPLSAFSEEEKPLAVYRGDTETVPPEGETSVLEDDPIRKQDHCCDRQVKAGEAFQMSPWEIQNLLERTAQEGPPSKKTRSNRGKSSGRR